MKYQHVLYIAKERNARQKNYHKCQIEQMNEKSIANGLSRRKLLRQQKQ